MLTNYMDVLWEMILNEALEEERLRLDKVNNRLSGGKKPYNSYVDYLEDLYTNYLSPSYLSDADQMTKTAHDDLVNAIEEKTVDAFINKYNIIDDQLLIECIAQYIKAEGNQKNQTDFQLKGIVHQELYFNIVFKPTIIKWLKDNDLDVSKYVIRRGKDASADISVSTLQDRLPNEKQAGYSYLMDAEIKNNIEYFVFTSQNVGTYITEKDSFDEKSLLNVLNKHIERVSDGVENMLTKKELQQLLMLKEIVVAFHNKVYPYFISFHNNCVKVTLSSELIKNHKGFSITGANTDVFTELLNMNKIPDEPFKMVNRFGKSLYTMIKYRGSAQHVWYGKRGGGKRWN